MHKLETNDVLDIITFSFEDTCSTPLRKRVLHLINENLLAKELYFNLKEIQKKAPFSEERLFELLFQNYIVK